MRHLLSHTAGLSGWQEPMAPDDLYDWEKAAHRARRAGAVVGARHGVGLPRDHAGLPRRRGGPPRRRADRRHVLRRGGRRAARRRLPHRPRRGARRPRRPGDPAAAARSADRRPAPTPSPLRTLANPPLVAEQSWEEAWRRAEIPAAGGHGNARSVATVQSALACGGELDGVRLLSRPGARPRSRSSRNGTDLVLGLPIRSAWATASTPEMPLSPNPRACFWGGWGGSIVVDRPRRPALRRLRDEPDGRGHARRLRGAGIVMAA